MLYSGCMIISIVNTKGGAGKTTTCVMTAIALSKLGKSVEVLDLDIQGSTTQWARIAADDGTPLPFSVSPANIATLRGYKSSVPYTLVDTPPTDPAAIDAAVKAADVVVIPSPTGLLDTDRAWETAGVVAPTVPTYVLVTKYDGRSKDGPDFIRELDAQGVARFETVIHASIPLQRVRGTVANPAKFGYDVFTNELLEVL